MADRTPAPDTPELRACWGGFGWTPEGRMPHSTAIGVVFGEGVR